MSAQRNIVRQELMGQRDRKRNGDSDRLAGAPVMGRRSRQWLTVFMLGTSLGAAQARAEPGGKMRCDFYKSIICPVTGCYDGPTKGWSIIDWSAKAYFICDPSACQKFPFDYFVDGIYVSFTFPKRDLMLKLNLSDDSAVETATMLNAAFVSFGNCAALSAP